MTSLPPLLHSPEEFPRLSEEDCIAIQNTLAPYVLQRNTFWEEMPRTAAGVDLAYWRQGEEEMAVCCVVTVDCQTKQVVEKRQASGRVAFSYLPGCFAFRELPLVIAAAAKLREWPDIFVFDGNGILHPRGMGLAAHASFYLRAPTMGVAKHYYRVDGAESAEPGEEPGSFGEIVKEGQVLGRAVRTRRGVKPVFVSVGNWVTLDTATRLALQLTGGGSRLPLPTWYADLETHTQRQQLREPHRPEKSE